MDRWLMSETHRLIREVDDALDGFDTARAGGLIATFIEDLSNWYVRRSRRKFWDGDPAALATLHEAITTLTLVMAPMTPFITERVWQDLVRPTSTQGSRSTAESVHLADWPTADASLINDELAHQMAQVRRLVELGRAARAESGVKTRQPLSRALVSAPGWETVPSDLQQELATELNVVSLASLGTEGQDLVHVSAKANFRALGKRFGPETPRVAEAISASDPQMMQAAFAASGHIELSVGGEPVQVNEDEVLLTETPREGWAVQHDAGESIALDLELTPELRRLGLARDVVRQIQEARKASGLDVADRIAVRWQAPDELRAAITAHHEAIAAEVLATEWVEAEVPAGDGGFEDAGTGLRFALSKVI
jgi:isoleucyl-tRNA synthetase